MELAKNTIEKLREPKWYDLSKEKTKERAAREEPEEEAPGMDDAMLDAMSAKFAGIDLDEGAPGENGVPAAAADEFTPGEEDTDAAADGKGGLKVNVAEDGEGATFENVDLRGAY